EGRLERLAEARRTREAHHVERAAHLVQVLGAAAERARVEWRGSRARDLVAYPLERLVDLGGDPGKDGGVGHRSSRGALGELEAGDRVLQSLGEIAQARGRGGSLLRALARKLCHAQNDLHLAGDLRRRGGLLLGGV